MNLMVGGHHAPAEGGDGRKDGRQTFAHVAESTNSQVGNQAESLHLRDEVERLPLGGDFARELGADAVFPR